jgi:hypothetical protein
MRLVLLPAASLHTRCCTAVAHRDNVGMYIAMLQGRASRVNVEATASCQRCPLVLAASACGNSLLQQLWLARAVVFFEFMSPSSAAAPSHGCCWCYVTLTSIMHSCMNA